MLYVAFEVSASGWLTTHTRADSRELTITASYVPGELLLGLARALLWAGSMDGSFEAIAVEEGREVVFAFHRAGDEVRFSMSDRGTADTLFDFRGTPADVILPFWRALLDLEPMLKSVGWQWGYPSAEMRRLSTFAKSFTTAVPVEENVTNGQK